VAATLCACDRFVDDPGTRVVAQVGSTTVTAARLQAYLDANQFQDPAAEPMSPGDASRVRSRLFDDFLDGEVLIQEAKRRGITVTDAELAGYLGSDLPKSEVARELSRRDLTIQKLREAVVLESVHVDEAEIAAWLAARMPPGEPALRGTLRTLRLASYPEAARVRQEIVTKKMSFAEAELAYGADSLPDAPRNKDLDVLPPQIAAAVKSLQPGSVSPPLPFESSVLLFLLEADEDSGAAEMRRHEAARKAIALEKSQAVADHLLEELRKTTVVTKHLDELPFAYVAEGAAPHAQ
jgi:parvulin-like peptidyl-prolyl isomerase